MINLRSGLSALALVGAVVGFSPAAHATPIPTFFSVTAADGLMLDDSTSVVLSATTGKAPKYSVSILSQATISGDENSAGGNSVGSKVATGVDFTLDNLGTKVTWTPQTNFGFDPESISYKLVAGTPTQGNYNSLPGLTEVTVGDSLTWSGLTGGNSYALIIQATSTLLSKNSIATLTGTLSAVPLPGSLVMFGSALLGLTAFGARRRSALSA